MPDLPFDFWESERRILLAILLPRVEQMTIAGADMAIAGLATVGMAFDNALAHEPAARWAREYTDQVLDQLGTTTQGSVGEVLENWITQGGTRQDLVDVLKPILDDNEQRADLTAVTESTRAFAQGAAITYLAAGMPSVSFAPPGHPGCRCWLRPVYLKSGEWVVVWSTNRDEVVCKRKIDTPWGIVEGCRDLHDVVVSEGAYLGQPLGKVK
jgi:hypothetical protein